jgi:pseudaminic acid synthase
MILTAALVIGQRIIGPEYHCYIIAELFANHCNDYELTVRTLHSMKEYGGNAMKVQTYNLHRRHHHA